MSQEPRRSQRILQKESHTLSQHSSHLFSILPLSIRHLHNSLLKERNTRITSGITFASAVAYLHSPQSSPRDSDLTSDLHSGSTYGLTSGLTSGRESDLHSGLTSDLTSASDYDLTSASDSDLHSERESGCDSGPDYDYHMILD
jgi:hypothetical protein